MQNNLRYIISVLIETESSLVVNSGDRTLLLDNAIVRDCNALPFIPGTSIAGVLKHLYEDTYSYNDAKSLFGYIRRSKGNDKGQGSRLIFSDAHIAAEDGETILDGISDIEDTEYIRSLMEIPDRDHVKINDRGTVDKSNKYDRQLLRAGNRFGFEIELIGNEKDEQNWTELVSLLYHPLFRLGAGTRNGSGKVKVLEIAEKVYDLTKEEDLQDYLSKGTSLNNSLSANRTLAKAIAPSKDILEDISVELEPRDFFFFGTSLPDIDVDNAPKIEQKRVWENGKCSLKEYYLLPATSIKGALSHRTAFHFNKLTKSFVGQEEGLLASDFGWNAEECVAKIELPNISDIKSSDEKGWQQQIDEVRNMNFDMFLQEAEDWQSFLRNTDGAAKTEVNLPVGEENPAVAFWFGSASDNEKSKGSIGRVLIEDVYLDKEVFETHIFNHVKIDRLTGGASNGALFQEKAVYKKDSIELKIKLHIPQEKTDDYADMRTALDAAMDDLKNERLQLGGATTKGYGFFKAK